MTFFLADGATVTGEARICVWGDFRPSKTASTKVKFFAGLSAAPGEDLGGDTDSAASSKEGITYALPARGLEIGEDWAVV